MLKLLGLVIFYQPLIFVVAGDRIIRMHPKLSGYIRLFTGIYDCRALGLINFGKGGLPEFLLENNSVPVATYKVPGVTLLQ